MRACDQNLAWNQTICYLVSYARLFSEMFSALLLKHFRPAAVLQIAKTLHEHVSKYCQVVLDSLAYAGTGDVLKVQELLAMCGEHIETEENTAWKVCEAPGWQAPGLCSLSCHAVGVL